MEVKRIFWTEFATNQLEQIFDYHKYKANIKIAKKIIFQIIDRTILLETMLLILTPCITFYFITN